MGTSAAYGIKKNGELKSMYCHYDGYIDGLGKDLIKEIKEIGIDNMHNLFDRLHIVKDEVDGTIPTLEQIAFCKKNNWCDFGVSGGGNSWYCLLRQTQGTFKPLLKCKGNVPVYGYYAKMNFYYGYIIDLDEKRFYLSSYGVNVAYIPFKFIFKFKTDVLVKCLEEQMFNKLSFNEVARKLNMC